MKNLKYFPYERNKYFYGKLLSVDDFEAEQKYMNDKRRLINRFMHGCGVVCGLDVVAVSDDTVSLEAGLALDFCGREIVVDKPVTKKLSDMEGYPDYSSGDENMGYLYLCIEYAEHEKDPVYSVVGGNSMGEEACYNKTAEGYHVYVTSQEPEASVGGSSAYFEEWKTVYWGNGIRISQVFPKYVKSGSEFDFRLVVENMGQRLPVSFGYELSFDCLKKDGKKKATIEFHEEAQTKARRYEIPVTLAASAIKGGRGGAKLKPGTFWLKVGEHSLEASAEAENTVEITSEEVLPVITRHYYENAMKEIQQETYHQSIYLAKIALIQAGTTVIIENVEQMPFGQYICSDVLSAIRDRVSEEEQKYQARRLAAEGKKEKKNTAAAETREQDIRMASGCVTLDLGIGGVAGQTFFSGAIPHGLGLSDVTVLLGEAYGVEDETRIRFGAADVFAEDSCPVRGELAARVDKNQGTFVIGIRLTEPTTEEKVRIHWTALCDGRVEAPEKEARGLFLKPDMVYLSLREDYYFEPVFNGAADTGLQWSVSEAEGGSIDENGLYTAPDIPGIYEIVAESTAYPGMKASAFAVVREIRKDSKEAVQ